MEKIARDLSQEQKRNSYLFSSRCIANYAEIVKATVQKFQEQGLKPFLFPAIGSSGAISPEQLRMIRIKNTASLGVIEVSDAYQNELSKRNDQELIAESQPMTFDADRNLTPF